MSQQIIKVVALFKARSGQVEALKAALTGLIEPTCKEKGCLVYELHQNTENSTDFAFIEEWENNETLDAHLKSAHILEAIPKVSALVMAPPDIRRYVKCK